MIVFFSLCAAVASLIVGFIGYFNLKRTSKKLLVKLEIESVDHDTLDEEERRLLKQTVNWSLFICFAIVLSLVAQILSYFRKLF